MCGKFAQMLSWRELHDLPDLAASSGDGPVEAVSPMRYASVIRLGEDGRRESVRMRWGFASLKAKDPTERPDHIHARAETLDTKPTFREAFMSRRSILAVKTFNEGEEIRPSKTLQHTVTPRDGKPIAIAVLWERWTHRTEGELLTFVMVTTPANALISRITDRMPAVLAPEHWAKWLGEEPATPAELKAMLVPFDGDWDMAPEKKTPPPKKPGAQGEMF